MFTLSRTHTMCIMKHYRYTLSTRLWVCVPIIPRSVHLRCSFVFAHINSGNVPQKSCSTTHVITITLTTWRARMPSGCRLSCIYDLPEIHIVHTSRKANNAYGIDTAAVKSIMWMIYLLADFFPFIRCRFSYGVGHIVTRS